MQKVHVGFERVREFIRTWKKLAARSLVDALGGVEYHRVFRQWSALGRPVPCRGLLVSLANSRA